MVKGECGEKGVLKVGVWWREGCTEEGVVKGSVVKKGVDRPPDQRNPLELEAATEVGSMHPTNDNILT